MFNLSGMSELTTEGKILNFKTLAISKVVHGYKIHYNCSFR